MKMEMFALFRAIDEMKHKKAGNSMKFYDQTDLDTSKREKSGAIRFTLLMMLPFLAAAIAGFLLRVELLCTAGCILAGAVVIFLYDLRIKPALRYCAFLEEAHSGLTRQTGGALVRIGCDPVYQDGVDFYEIILNIYEDLDEEGERRFLLDSKKEIPADWLNHDVIVTSHGSYLLEARRAANKSEEV